MYIQVAFRILGGRPTCLPSRAHTLVRPYRWCAPTAGAPLPLMHPYR
jgi:hypothetical protein